MGLAGDPVSSTRLCRLLRPLRGTTVVGNSASSSAIVGRHCAQATRMLTFVELPPPEVPFTGRVRGGARKLKTRTSPSEDPVTSLYSVAGRKSRSKAVMVPVWLVACSTTWRPSESKRWMDPFWSVATRNLFMALLEFTFVIGMNLRKVSLDPGGTSRWASIRNFSYALSLDAWIRSCSWRNLILLPLLVLLSLHCWSSCLQVRP
mmetsp:Transcript_23715/g.57568  ORF Transcript_23715/g.57568 Transcript_23715/m.57568 type:complete len:205 (-) Transcript_23715:196-810(-)